MCGDESCVVLVGKTVDDRGRRLWRERQREEQREGWMEGQEGNSQKTQYEGRLV